MKLTEQQCKELASVLRETQRNAFIEIESRFGAAVTDVDDDIFERLRAEQGLLLCDHCGFWRPTSIESESVPDVCMGCEDNAQAAGSAEGAPDEPEGPS